MAMALVLERDVTRSECPWLQNDLPKGTKVYTYMGPTYGSIGHNGIAVSDKDDPDAEFYELPLYALGKPPSEKRGSWLENLFRFFNLYP